MASSPLKREREESVTGGKDESRGGTRRNWLLTAVGLGVWLAGILIFTFTLGIAISRDWIFVWTLLFLLALSLHDPRRWVRGVIFDWLPFFGLLFAYDVVLSFSPDTGIHPHVAPMINFDRTLFGTVPTVSLQRHFYHPLSPRWYDFISWGVYLTHFISIPLIAGVLWRVNHRQFRRFRAYVVALATGGLVTYILFPAVPPWLAANLGYIPPVQRVVADVWNYMGVHIVSSVLEGGGRFVDLVACVPSLHAGYPMLYFLFFWSGGSWWIRFLTGAYAVVMAVMLVYTGEHYVADVLLGWVYAIAIFTFVNGVRLWRERHQRMPISTATDSAGSSG